MEKRESKIKIDSSVGYADDTWQIGSKKPPKVCLCCGLRFDDEDRKIHGPYLDGPYRYVCDWCWRREFLFFPDKVEGSDTGEWISG